MNQRLRSMAMNDIVPNYDLLSTIHVSPIFVIQITCWLRIWVGHVLGNICRMKHILCENSYSQFPPEVDKDFADLEGKIKKYSMEGNSKNLVDTLYQKRKGPLYCVSTMCAKAVRLFSFKLRLRVIPICWLQGQWIAVKATPFFDSCVYSFWRLLYPRDPASNGSPSPSYHTTCTTTGGALEVLVLRDQTKFRGELKYEIL